MEEQDGWNECALIQSTVEMMLNFNKILTTAHLRQMVEKLVSWIHGINADYTEMIK